MAPRVESVWAVPPASASASVSEIPSWSRYTPFRVPAPKM